MKSKSIRRNLGGATAAFLVTAAIPSASATVSIDGIRDVADAYSEDAVQSITSNWGTSNALSNLHSVQEGASLCVFMGGRVVDNAFLLFIDSKPGGATFIPNNLITSGGEEYTINNLGTSSSAGLTFENGFEPDYALRIYGNTDGTQAYINRYNLQTGTRSYVGQAVAAAVPPSGFVEEIQVSWADVTGANADVINGAEMKLSLASLGVPFGPQTVKVMAVLVGNSSNWGSNQVLASKSTSDDMAGGVNSINFETEPGIQTISIAVDNNDTDGDGTTDDIDTDDDDDGLLDTEESDDGNYVSPTETGTDPLVADTDEDGASDGDEVLNNYFGFLSNPNIPNYETMAVPGSFTDPQWQVDGSAGNSMVMVGTSLIEQYQWTLDYKFETTGTIEYKYAANGSYINSWGDGGNNISSTVEATGFHRFEFDNSTLARSFSRITYPDVGTYLAAYGLSAGGDEDVDNILNEDEFTANTDPTNPDTDGDGLNDNVDPNPLFATRNILFSVNMQNQEALGLFDPNTDTVSVDFFEGLAGSLPDLPLTDLDEDGIWTGTLTAFQGPEGASFGTYKFRSSAAGAPDSGYEGAINNRTFDLGPANTQQDLPVVFFNDFAATPGTYAFWTTANAGGQTASQDFDGDDVANGVEYFMGETGSGFTPNPAPVEGVVSWPRDPEATGVSFKVWTSENLSFWTDVTATPNVDTSDPNFVKYTLPAGTKLFVRLEVVVD